MGAPRAPTSETVCDFTMIIGCGNKIQLGHVCFKMEIYFKDIIQTYIR